MDKSIFYSWQSDLPNNKNRGFIQSCLEQAVAAMKEKHLHLEIAVDRDTLGAAGTPDISATIFSKIEIANIFVADISFINPGSPGRKTPNPNVLIELGYAAKCIGWSHIICIFNEEFGDVEELPFDLRFRRPITYRVENNNNKSKERQTLSDQLQSAMSAIIRIHSAKEEVKGFLKSQIDKEILAIAEDIYKIVYGYDAPFSSGDLWPFFQLSRKEFEQKLSNRAFLGFTELKDWQHSRERLNVAINQPFFVQHAHESFIQPLVRIIGGLSLLDWGSTNSINFRQTGDKAEGYKVVYGQDMNPSNTPDRYLLLQLSSENSGTVIDFGNFRSYDKDRLLYMHEPGEKYDGFVLSLHGLLESIYLWVKSTGNNIIIAP